MARNRTTEMSSISDLRDEYVALVPLAERLRNGLSEQLNQIVVQKSLALAVPIVSRIKSWDSIAEKFERKELDLNSVTDLPDLVGLRLIFLFSRDLETAIVAIGRAVSVIDQENTAARLGASQFGYQSLHSTVRIPNEWTKLPAFVDCGQFQVELQMRTIAQHTWAAASHHLQYKREESVPLEVRRSISRVSALLETVDLEFERLLHEREEYVTSVVPKSPDDEPLNVDILTTVLDEKSPPANRVKEENYDQLVVDLNSAGIHNAKELKDLIDGHLDAALEYDREMVDGKHPRDEQRAPIKMRQFIFTHTSGPVPRHAVLGVVGVQ